MLADDVYYCSHEIRPSAQLTRGRLGNVKEIIEMTLFWSQS